MADPDTDVQQASTRRSSGQKLILVVASRSQFDQMQPFVVYVSQLLSLSVDVWLIREMETGSAAAQEPNWVRQLVATQELLKAGGIAEVFVFEADFKALVSRLNRASNLFVVVFPGMSHPLKQVFLRLFEQVFVRSIWLAAPRADWSRMVAVQYENSPNSKRRLITRIRQAITEEEANSSIHEVTLSLAKPVTSNTLHLPELQYDLSEGGLQTSYKPMISCSSPHAIPLGHLWHTTRQNKW